MHFDTNLIRSSKHELLCLILTYFIDVFIHLDEKVEFEIDINIFSSLFSRALFFLVLVMKPSQSTSQ